MNKHASYKKNLINTAKYLLIDFFSGIKKGICLIVSVPLFILVVCLFVFGILLIVCFFKMVIFGEWTTTDFMNNIFSYLMTQLKSFYLPIWAWIVSLLKRIFSFITI